MAIATPEIRAFFGMGTSGSTETESKVIPKSIKISEDCKTADNPKDLSLCLMNENISHQVLCNNLWKHAIKTQNCQQLDQKTKT